MAFNSKKRLFADAVLAGKSNRDAAIAAGYSAATASAAGSRLVKDKDVVAYLVERRKKGGAKPKPAQAETDAAITKAAVAAGFDLNTILTFSDPKAFLLAAMNDQNTEPKLRVDAAKTLMPFMHAKMAEAGKKDAKADAAKKAGAGKFAATVPPKLVVNNRK
ncbi:terminase small subunit [Paraburkholderia sp. BL21I4N1]|uniref:terminase small subunit n=1 Tax=Paraburkholderia sp. BL21I4N1 TaxID=1938801 RepID=UPI000CFC0C28|nr:terminase small subunit [Paraburkholderia sp. BL21I4N1]PQV50981.1 phage terminase small subunit [Paraburkholderia sp. BL21I4N1]